MIFLVFLTSLDEFPTLGWALGFYEFARAFDPAREGLRERHGMLLNAKRRCTSELVELYPHCDFSHLATEDDEACWLVDGNPINLPDLPD